MTVAFLLDVDNTLLDNDGLKAWGDRALRDAVGDAHKAMRVDRANRFSSMLRLSLHLDK